MRLRLLPIWLAAAAFLVAWNLDLGTSHQLLAAQPVASNVSFNYYVPPGGCGGPGAQLYVCPLPTPPWVGHTYVPYQPLMPHEFLYRHCRTYYRRNPGSGWTRTWVQWQ